MTRTGPVINNVAAIDYDGDRYCIDCAKQVLDGRDFGFRNDEGDWESIEDADGEEIVERLIEEEYSTLSMGGRVEKGSVTNNYPDESPLNHCGRHRDCIHSLSGDEHDFDHNETVGVELEV